MKNLFLLETDKPSSGYVLGKCIKELSDVKIGEFTRTYYLMFSNEYFQPQNIYITNDEKPKKGEWSIYLGLQKKYKVIEDIVGDEFPKIILTTDQDLMKDGVQDIPDEFLEWFVKNPSCEEVGIVDDKKLSSKNIYDAAEGDLVYSHHGYGGIINSLSKDVRVGIDNYIETAITSETGWETLDINNYKIYDKCYKIIIPKEEPDYTALLKQVGTTQETLEQFKKKA